jgi:hypothetical protein
MLVLDELGRLTAIDSGRLGSARSLQAIIEHSDDPRPMCGSSPSMRWVDLPAEVQGELIEIREKDPDQNLRGLARVPRCGSIRSSALNQHNLAFAPLADQQLRSRPLVDLLNQ